MNTPLSLKASLFTGCFYVPDLFRGADFNQSNLFFPLINYKMAWCRVEDQFNEDPKPREFL